MSPPPPPPKLITGSKSGRVGVGVGELVGVAVPPPPKLTIGPRSGAVGVIVGVSKPVTFWAGEGCVAVMTTGTMVGGVDVCTPGTPQASIDRIIAMINQKLF